MIKKRCSKCRRSLPPSNFHIDRQKGNSLCSRCNFCRKFDRMLNYQKNKEKVLRQTDEWAKKHREYLRMFGRRKRIKLMIEIFSLIGQSCARCGITDKRILQIDHIKGNGYAMRKIVKGTSQYEFMLGHIKKGSEDYQILCANCNLIEGIEKGYKKSLWSD